MFWFFCEAVGRSVLPPNDLINMDKTSAAWWFMICGVCRGVWCKYMLQRRPVCRGFWPVMSLSTRIQRDAVPVRWVSFPLWLTSAFPRTSWVWCSSKTSAPLWASELTSIFSGGGVVKALIGTAKTLCFHFALQNEPVAKLWLDETTLWGCLGS